MADWCTVEFYTRDGRLLGRGKVSSAAVLAYAPVPDGAALVVVARPGAAGAAVFGVPPAAPAAEAEQ